MRVRKFGKGDRTHLIGKELDELVGQKDSHVRRIQLAVEVVVRSPDLGVGRHEVGYDDTATGPAHPGHLPDRDRRVTEMVQSTAAEDEIKGLVEEGQVGGIAFLEQHVGHTGFPEAIGPQPEEVRCQVDADDLAHVGRELFRHMGRPTGDVEHQHVVAEGLDPAGGSGGAIGERRIVTGEQPDLPGERLPNFLVRELFVHPPLVHSSAVTVAADLANYLPGTANHQRLVDMRGETEVTAGTYVYDGPDLVTGWHSHDLHQLEYAFEGTIEVETESAHYLLPPRQAAWIPAGLSHSSILKGVRTISVFFAPDLVPDEGGRARILAAAPVIREMILYAVRWPISRPQSDPGADSFFTALAGLVLEWFDHEMPLCLPNTQDPLVRAVMEQTNTNLATVTAAEVCRRVGVSERTLRRAFPAATGMTWRQYLLESRLLRAMALLSEPGLTILDVASTVGFEGSSFTRAFVRHTGETPSAYRRRVSG